MNDIEKRIKELEEERDHLLATTPKVVTTTTKTGKQYTNHTSIKSKYNAKITSLKKYGVENPMKIKEVRDRQKNNAKKAWDNEDRRKQCSENWKRILSDPEIKKKRAEATLKTKYGENYIKKEAIKLQGDDLAKHRANEGIRKSKESYEKYKNLFKNNMISTYEEYYNKKNLQDIRFKCNSCGKIFKTSVYNYKNGMNRCHDCITEARYTVTTPFTLDDLLDVCKGQMIILNIKDLKSGVMRHSTPIKYQCIKCGSINETTAIRIMNEHGCPNMCFKEPSYQSSYEFIIKDYLIKLGLIEGADFIHSCRNIIKNKKGNYMELDFYFPKLKKAIEFNGTYYHSDSFLLKNKGMLAEDYHNMKYDLCSNENIDLLFIDETTFNDKKTLILDLLKNWLSNNYPFTVDDKIVYQWNTINKIYHLISNKKTLYARNLDIQEIDQSEANKFLKRHHLQGSASNQNVCLALTFDDKIVQVMTFGKPRYNKNYQYELIRLCSHGDYSITGGSERLFKYFIKEYKPESIISYCDNSKFSGNVYRKLNFKLEDKGKPTCHWYNSKTKRHILDSSLRMKGYSLLHNDPNYERAKKGESNEILMINDGYERIFDKGQSVYIYKDI